MISSKLDEVSRNSIWEEHVKKENRTLRLNTDFRIIDPKRIVVIPEKPNRTVPTQSPDANTIAMATATLSSLSSLKDTDKLPTERFAMPITGNMEYGFFSSTLAPPNPMFSHGRGECDVTSYAATYVRMAGSSPYQNKDNTVGR